MSQNDSDSSDGDSSVYKTTNVLLGYASKEPTNDGFSQLGGTPVWPDATSLPSAAFARCRNCNSFMTLLLQLLADLPETFPGHERRLYIFSCKRKPCRRKDGSIRVIRGTKAAVQALKKKDGASTAAQYEKGDNRKIERDDEPAEAPSEPAPRLGDSIFSSTFDPTDKTRSNPFAKPQSQTTARLLNDQPPQSRANPFSTSPKTSLPENPEDTNSIPSGGSKPDKSAPQDITPHKDLSTTFAEKARITPPSPQQQTPPTPPPSLPWPPPSSLPDPYPSYHLDADIETLDPTPPPSVSKPSSAMAIDPIANDPLDKDAFESSLDTTFQKFADRVAQNPEQVLRYEYGGQPLLYSSTDSVGKIFAPHHGPSHTGAPSGVKVAGRGGSAGIPNCGSCGGGRIFECQLMPAAITALEAEEEGLDGMEWGSMVVGVCGRDCGEGAEGGWGWREEWCGVQWEEVK